MDKLILITDLHITSEGDRIIGLDPVARLTSVLDAATTDHPDACAIVMMGDLTHHGRPDQYARLAQVLDRYDLPVIPMLGNHDRRDAFREVFCSAPRDDAGFVQSVFDLDHHRIITLDTLDGPPYPRGHHAGRLCPDRLAWLDAALLGAGDKSIVVIAHHPPFDTGIVGMDDIKLANGRDLLSRLAAVPTAHLICGHIHRTISGKTNGVSWTMLKSTCHQGVLDLTEPDSSLSVDEPAAYGLAILTPSSIAIHSQDVGFTNEILRDAHST